jgi:hypothetical protein
VSPAARRDYGVRMRTILTEPFRLRTWRETAWALLALWIGVFWFCVLVTLLATGIGLAITIVGLPILALTLVVANWGARLERSLARGLLRVHVDEPPTEVDESKESWRRVLQLLTSERRWRSVLYLLLLLPVGLLEFVVAVTVWAVALGYLSMPFWWWAVSDADFLWDGNRLDTPWEWALVVSGGFAALLAAPWLVRGCVWLHVALMRGLVGPTRRELARAAAQAGTERDQAVATATPRDGLPRPARDRA